MAGETIEIAVEDLKKLLNLAAKKENWRVRHVLHKKFPTEFEAPPPKKRSAPDGEEPLPPAKKVRFPALPPVALRDPAELVKTRQYIWDTVWPLVVRLHEQQPNHPMFGPRKKGKFQLPLGTKRGGTGTKSCWMKAIWNLAGSVENRMGQYIERGAC